MKLLSTLRGRLFALLAVLGTVTALAVGGATYVSVRAEADALFDYQLRQTALSLRDQGRVAGDEAAALTDPSFDYVVVNGALVVDAGQRTGALPGQILYGPGVQPPATGDVRTP